MRRSVVGIIALLAAGIGNETHGFAADEIQWSQVTTPSAAPARAIGSPARGCLAGAVAIPEDGPGFEVMRLSRHRFYGHPELIRFIESLAEEAKTLGWPGILVGDLAQPRGGPTNSGHRSHQTGLDVDIWFTPAPDRRLSTKERETRVAASVVEADGRHVDPKSWTSAHRLLLGAAASHGVVDRIFVNAAIKKDLCETVVGDRSWLRKIRPWWGHDDHFHVRLACPPGGAGDGCIEQDPVPAGDGCDASLDWWFSDEAMAALRKPKPPAKPITLDDLPPACRQVLQGG